MKVVVTGASGLLGWHACVRLHARNRAARFEGGPEPFKIVRVDHAAFDDANLLREAISGADAILHFAGVNRASDDDVEQANPAIAQMLVTACLTAGAKPHVVHANSIHAACDTPYGRSKRRADGLLDAASGKFTSLILPHVFGECARPHYNNVTATLIDQIIRGESPAVNPNGEVRLLHAGSAADAAIDAVVGGITGIVEPSSRREAVPDLLEKLRAFHADYECDLFPDLSDPLDLALFNSYRAALYPSAFPRPLRQNTDQRGTLFEAVRGAGGQTFLSWTEPGSTRGNHFHLEKVERFLVLQGEAIIRMRRVHSQAVWDYRVSGAQPAIVDIPTLHTHSIENVGDQPLLTLFWAHELFDPDRPDTYSDPVIEACP